MVRLLAQVLLTWLLNCSTKGTNVSEIIEMNAPNWLEKCMVNQGAQCNAVIKDAVDLYLDMSYGSIR